ncbi:arsenate reductase/protein-tyrosine-phosphatase family protein [Blastococcus sp. SYSU DS0616]
MRLLFVCTGNICRSAAAAVLAGAWPAGHLGLTVEARSAGTRAPAGRAAHPLTVAALEQRGLTAEDHVARRLSAADLAWADVVLGMSVEHREAALALDPRCLRKTFTLLEAAALCAELPPHRLAGVVPEKRGKALAEALMEVRGLHRGHSSAGVEDPIDGGAELHTQVVDEIAAALRTILMAVSRQIGGARQQTIRVDRLPPVPA